VLGLAEFFTVVGRALTFDTEVHELVQRAPWGNLVVGLIVVLAGLSEALGQSLVLFASRVKPRRFVLSLLFSASIYAFSFFFLAFSVFVVGTQVFGREVGVGTTLRAVGLGYAPYLFSFFVLAPYFGNPISWGLSLWSLLAVVSGVQVAFALSAPQALLCAFLGWLLLQLAQRTVGRPLVGGVRWLRRRVAGAPLATSRSELRELFDLPQNPRARLEHPPKQDESR
jgi:hypothetical protein